MGIHNPLPMSLSSECKKAASILDAFVNPKTLKSIPPKILASAKGLAVFTVFKIGFMGSARFGSGLVVARLADGTWSAPSAIGTGGLGVGGQVGLEFTDFVVVLNTTAAVRSFSQLGSLMLGGNLSFTIGPMGRNVEANGAASAKGVAGFFSYSKTRGFFGGVSLEGTVLLERRDANEKLYHRRVTAHELLSGMIPVPAEAGSLMSVLELPAFSPPASSDVSAEGPADVSAEGPADVSAEGPADVSAEGPADVSAKGPADVSAEGPADVSAEGPADVSAKGPAELNAPVPAEEHSEILCSTSHEHGDEVEEPEQSVM